MSVPNVLCESGGEIIDQSGWETHGLMYYSFTECTCARLERVCARVIRCICIMFHSFTKHFHISHLTHTATLWDK